MPMPRNDAAVCVSQKPEPKAEQRTWTVHWTETYRMTGVPAKSEAEAIETAKTKMCSREDEGENVDTQDFFAEEE